MREADGGARVLAGGQSLMPALNMRLDAPSRLVDINGIAGLGDIAVRDGMLEIGALARHADILRSPLAGQHAPLLVQALPYVAHPAIRNRGTIGGSLALADPAAELPACLLALSGAVEITGAEGARTVAADDFFRGLFETALKPDEILTRVLLPVATARSRHGFAEIARRHGDYALVGLAATAAADTLESLRLVFFGVGPTPMRAGAAEQALTGGQDLDTEACLDAAIAALAQDLDPDDDLHASAKAKRHLAGVLLRRVIGAMRDLPARGAAA